MNPTTTTHHIKRGEQGQCLHYHTCQSRGKSFFFGKPRSTGSSFYLNIEISEAWCVSGGGGLVVHQGQSRNDTCAFYMYIGCEKRIFFFWETHVCWTGALFELFVKQMHISSEYGCEIKALLQCCTLCGKRHRKSGLLDGFFWWLFWLLLLLFDRPSLLVVTLAKKKNL